MAGRDENRPCSDELARGVDAKGLSTLPWQSRADSDEEPDIGDNFLAMTGGGGGGAAAPPNGPGNVQGSSSLP
eukprot:5099155-Prymnesium_polylepis.1